MILNSKNNNFSLDLQKLEVHYCFDDDSYAAIELDQDFECECEESEEDCECQYRALYASDREDEGGYTNHSKFYNTGFTKVSQIFKCFFKVFN